MELGDTDLFGSPDQRAMQRRAGHLWTLLGEQPDILCYGRSIGLTGDRPDTIDRQIALARVQGVAPAECVPADQVEARLAALRSAGLNIDLYNRWAGGDEAVTACRHHLAQASLPPDLTVVEIDKASPPETLARLDAFAAESGVLLPLGPSLKGEVVPAVCLMAVDQQGAVVCCTSAIGAYHPTSPMGHTFFWGMLATDPLRRGQGIAKTLGAMSLLAMVDRHGLTIARTGIRPGNVESEKLCTKLGLSQAEVIVTAIDPTVYASDRITK